MGAELSIGLEWLAVVQRELLLFAGVFCLIGAIDEFAVDLTWLWMRLTGRVNTLTMPTADLRNRQLTGRAAVFIPAWQEQAVIGHTIAHALSAWPHPELRLFVGCYRNDPETLAAAMLACGNDPRLRLVVHDVDGPTDKADCLNRLYRALAEDERRSGKRAHMVLLHDAEDMVDPAALALLDKAIELAEFVQLPVLPAPQRKSRWIGSHYCEEFAEAHGKTMVVRGALATGLPAAGVGCAFARDILDEMARRESGLAEAGSGPFASGSLTEDYELGLRIYAAGGRSRFLRVRGEDGQLVATRAFFPSDIESAVRQKSRWVHGIALQGWDRLGWSPSTGEWWMRLRDRRGPFSALVLACAYLFLVLWTVSLVLQAFGRAPAWEPDGALQLLIWLNVASFLWRGALRFAFTAREYGAAEGLWAVARTPVANVIAIMAGRRALFAYLRTLGGAAPQWDKTAHHAHPTMSAATLEAAR
jgi:adsorption protein B